MNKWKLAKLNGTLEETYKKEVVRRIRKKYSFDDELGFQRNRDRKPEEFAEYDAFVENCKAAVKTEMEEV